MAISQVLTLTSSGQEWQLTFLLTSSGQEWQFHIAHIVKTGYLTFLLTSSCQE